MVFEASFPYVVGSYTNSAVGFFESTQIDTTLSTADNAPATQVIRIFGPNVAPVANNDSSSTVENTPLDIDVLANDTDANDNINPASVNLNIGSATGSGTWSVNSSGIVTFTPTAGWVGTATIQYTVSDTGGLTSNPATITVTVNLATPEPRINAISNRTINEDAPMQTVNLSGITTGAGSSVTITASSSNTGIIPHPTVTYTSPNSTGTLTFTPVANAYGTVTITVTAQHNGGGSDTTVTAFLVVVNPVNDAPSFTKGADISVNRVAGSVSFIGWATSISPGPSNESDQTVSFTVSNNNNGLFSTQPTISSSGTLTFTTQGANTGTATVTVTAVDNGGTANGGVNSSAAETFTITVGAAGLIPATGGHAISAATNAGPSGSWVRLTGPEYREGAFQDVNPTGTIILHAPTGFEFDTNTVAGPAPTVISLRISGSGTGINSANTSNSTAVAMTPSTISLSIGNIDSGSAVSALIWTNIRVRALAGSPLRTGYMTNSGTTTNIAGVVHGVTSWGTLNMVAGPAAALQIVQQPSPTAIAGENFVQQPVVRVVDAAGNWLNNDNTTVITATRFSGSGTLQGTTTLTVVNGEVKYTNLNHLVAGTINIQFSSGSLTPVTSQNVVISPGAAANLSIQTQPSPTATAGVAFAQQPVIRIEDAYGNLITNSVPVTVTRNAGSGTLQGTTTVNAVNGIATFTNLHHFVAGTINLQFTSPGLNSATSSNIVIGHGPAAQLSIFTQPSATATAGVSFVQQPVIRILDQYGNLVTSDNTTQITVVRNLGGGILQGTTTLTASGGVVTYSNLHHFEAGTINLTFTSSTGLTPASSTSILIQPAAAAGLAIEAQPSKRATVNVAFLDQPAIIVVDQYGNFIPTDTGRPITLTNSGPGVISGTTTLNTIGGIVYYSGLSHPTFGTIQLHFNSPGLTGVVSHNVVITPDIAKLIFTVQPQDTQAGATMTAVVVQLANSSDQPVAAGGVEIELSKFSGSGILSGTTTVLTDSTGAVTYNNLSIDLRGFKRLEAASDTMTALSDIFQITGIAPTLTSVSPLGGGNEDTPLTISYATLAGAANEADADGDPICFRVEAVNSGTLTINGNPVVPGSTLICAGDSVVWTPAPDANGLLNAF
ncbi:MAG: beta strand repeat-containing protein, partial [Limisphaerales bacterium]